MISPVNSDKPISTSTEQSGRSSQTSQKSTQASAASTTRQTQATQANNPTVEVDQARRLFEIENNRARALENTLQTPEQARSLLDSIVQQLAASPKSAAEAQAGKAAANSISAILQNAPA